MVGKLKLITLLVSLKFAYSFDPVTLTAFGLFGAGAIYTGAKVYCRFNECCDENWLMYNITGLNTSLKNELYGQHLAQEIVAETVKNHFEQLNSKKPLVMLFYGYTGSGKSFLSDIIAKCLFKKGLESKFIIKKIATHDYKYPDKLQAYQADLKKLIESSTKKCERSLFIFDEVDKMQKGLVDVLKPYLDSSINGASYRNSIFILLSNNGGNLINSFVSNHTAKGKRREDIKRDEVNQLLSEDAINRPDGLKNAEFCLSGLIDLYVPFLPLERKHIKLCAAAELRRRGKPYYDETLEMVANELQYFPEKEKLFSADGCKRVVKKVDLFLS